MITLSEREHLVAEQYCKGLADKEVADSLQRSEWTIKAQKRDCLLYTSPSPRDTR